MIQPFDLVEIINETLEKGDKGYIEYLMDDNKAMVILERDGDWTVLHTKDLKKIGEKVLSPKEAVKRLGEAFSKMRYGMREILPVFQAAYRKPSLEKEGAVANIMRIWSDFEKSLEISINRLREKEEE
jgi:hypothetical protein